MKQIDVEELKQIQIEILDVVDNFCKKNNINYWIDCGTLLGAVRHKGYIPWDDDIDVGMLRNDYDKFMDLFNKENNRYKFYCVENKKDFNYPYGKVLDTETILYEPNKKHGDKLSVNIDIFVYDNAPDDQKIVNKMFRKINIYSIFNYVKKSPVATTRKFSITNIIRIPCYYILKLLPKAFFSRRIINVSRKYINRETKRIGNFTSVPLVTCNKRVFDSFIKVPFEGKMYSAPVGYNEYLKEFYGEYMELPPEEKRVSTHKFEAYENN